MVARFRKRFRVRRYACGESWACSNDAGDRLVLFADAAMSRDALERIRDAHERIRSPHVARVVDADFDGNNRFIAFDCPAEVDLDLIADAASQSNIRLPFGAAVAFNEFVMDALEAAHHADRGPLFMSALGWRNVLIASDGRMWLFGWGENFPANNLDRGVANTGNVCIAPEIAFGKAPDAGADVYAAFALIRSLLPHVDIHPAFAAAAVGESEPLATALATAIGELSTDVLARSAAVRIGDIATLRSRYRGIRALDPSIPVPDETGLRAFLNDLVNAARGDAPPPSSRVTTTTLTIDHAQRTARVGEGAAIDMRRRKALWQLVLGLAHAHANDMGPLSVEQLQAAGWPDENILVEAGRARVYVAISTLRRLGLADVLIRNDEGYLIDPGVKLVAIPP